MEWKKWLKWAGIGLVLIFALIGVVFTAVFLGMRFGIFDVAGSIAGRNSFFTGGTAGSNCISIDARACAWAYTEEWATIREGLRKDAPTIARASAATGVPARLIAAVVVPEQLRFFTSEREVYKQVFEPLKILGSLSQFSLGVTGIKQETAEDVEARVPANLQNLIAYDATDTDHRATLFNRLTDQHDHYYSYLYTALFIKEVTDEWARASYPIADKPAVIATLFNIGFGNSHPNASPHVGGAEIVVANTTYTFGELAGRFYDSPELTDVFLK